MNAPTFDELGATAGALGTSEALIEKDWHIVQVLALISRIQFAGVTTAFSGGTSLSKTHDVIRRFSEDIDFKCAQHTPAGMSGNKLRITRRGYFEKVKSSLNEAGYQVIHDTVRDEYRSFQLDIAYPTVVPQKADVGLRPHIQLETSFHSPRMGIVEKPISSFVGLNRGIPPEAPAVCCTDLVETGADKLSALVWRLTSAHLGKREDAYKPELMRHVHDIAALEAYLIKQEGEFLRIPSVGRDDRFS